MTCKPDIPSVMRWVAAWLLAWGQIMGPAWARPADSPPASSPRPVTITMSPGLYMPGRKPLGVGPTLRQLDRAARRYEQRHPHVRIVLQGTGGADLSEGEHLKTQIMGGLAPDIVTVNAEVIWPDIDKGWWIALDPWLDRPNPYIPAGQPGSARWVDLLANPAMMRAKAAPDGRLYTLTYDLVETGIFYNRTIFDQLGLTPPRTWAAFIKLQQRLQDNGYIPIAMSIVQAGDWGQDYLFDQLHHPILDRIDPQKAAPELEAYFQGYLFPQELCWGIKRGFYGPNQPRYREMWRLMRQWRQYWPRDMLRPDRMRLFVMQKAPMIWDGSWLARRLRHDPLVAFEWGVFYLPPVTAASSPWAGGTDPAVLGGAGTQFAVTRMAADRGHLEQVMDFLAYLTTPQVAQDVISEAGMFVPNIKGVAMAQELEPFRQLVHHRFCTAKWWYTLDNRFNDANRRLIELFLNDAMTLETFLGRMDQVNQEAADRLIARHGWTFGAPPWPQGEAGHD